MIGIPTQIQPTPVLTGDDAQAVWEEMNRKPDPKEVEKIEKELKEMFEGIKERF